MRWLVAGAPRPNKNPGEAPRGSEAAQGAQIARRARGNADNEAFSSDDPYQVLGVRRGASVREVRAAYLHLVKELHPDGRPPETGDHNANERLKAINAAYRRLKAGSATAGAVERRGWARWTPAIFVVAALTSAAPVLVTLGAYYAGWLGPQAKPLSTADVREGKDAGATSVHQKDSAVGRLIAFADAKKRATTDAWAQFLATYPEGDTADLAWQAITAIELRQAAEARKSAERSAWTAAQKGTKAELQRFLASYPGGEHAGAAKQALAAIKRAEARERAEQAAWIAVERSGAKEDLLRLLDNHPDGAQPDRTRQAPAASKARVKADLDAWTSANRNGGIAALRQYLAD